MSPQAKAATDRLRAAWRGWWACSLLAGLTISAAASLAALVACTLVDALARLPRTGLAVLFGVWCVATLVPLAFTVARLVGGRRSLLAQARRIEEQFPELDSALINLVQFSGDDDPFRRAALAQAAAVVERTPIETAPSRETRRNRLSLCMQTPSDVAESLAGLAALVALAIGMHALVPTWASAAARVLQPWTFVPTVGAVKITRVLPGNVEVLVGSGLEIRAELAAVPAKSMKATLYVLDEKAASGVETALPMLTDAGRNAFVAALPQVLRPLKYRVEIGDSQTDRYAVTVYQRPTVSSVEATYQYPAYLGRAAATRTQNHADLDAPQFTSAALRIHPSTPITRGRLMLDGQTIEGRVEDDGNTLALDIPLDATTVYTIHLETSGGHVDPEPRVNRIKVEPDAPPTIALAEPARETSAAAGAKTAIVARASDDYGLGVVQIEVKTSDESAPTQTVASSTTFPDPSGSVLFHELMLDPARVKPGQTLLVRALARDRRSVDRPEGPLGPQEATTPWHAIHVVAPEASAAADLAQLESLRAAIAKLLQDQLRNRIAAAGVPTQDTKDAALKLAADVLAAQAAIQKAAVAVVASIVNPTDDEPLTIKRVMNKLAYGDMLRAVTQAEALAKLESPARAAEPAKALTATQDAVIDVLKRLLNDVRRETAELLAEMKKRADTSLPADAQDRLRALKDKLDEFLKQQKKVIETTDELAKKPVDDFTDRDAKELKALAATEDDWSKFMAEAHSDLSKLPEQDFSNPSALQELLAIETELKMAKDALTKKSADIAVPLEQLGAEMAKEMTTNIEKWLPDTPDRERWSQEEPLTDEMKEAPLAELPKELEDLVGDLMEDEEDLFDEMEDASSSWADSIDKGAGWDAMDGPISNMSARGVTGNRLPNTSEISGRSGEGRSGKATGEFVSDTAVGKGGRKTPTRLTADPYVKGQVKDTSKDPTGGATGGGKESGQGGEGLQGPVPNRPARDMQRLASKQASLRNKAEGVDLRFKVLQFHHEDLARLIGQMAAVEDDLRSGRYRSALRRRDVLLDGLGQVKMYVKGEFVVRQDQTANLPTEIQKEILGSMKEASPKGWEEMNRKYFERLSK